MTDKKVFYDLFNSKVDEFLRDLSNTFPDIKQFTQFKTAFTLMKNLDEKKPQAIFNNYVYASYGKQIKERDEQFFMETNFPIKSQREDYWLEFINNLRSIWKDLNDDNKNVIWTYLQLLVKLNEKCT